MWYAQGIVIGGIISLVLLTLCILLELFHLVYQFVNDKDCEKSIILTTMPHDVKEMLDLEYYDDVFMVLLMGWLILIIGVLVWPLLIIVTLVSGIALYVRYRIRRSKKESKETKEFKRSDIEFYKN